MTPADVKNKYVAIYSDFKKKGSQAKMLLLAMMIPASLYAYNSIYRYNEKLNYQHRGGVLSTNTLILIVIGVVIVFMTVILLTNALFFVQSKKILLTRSIFKKDIYQCFKQEIPELNDYTFIRKIQPDIFNLSGLFHTRYSDYIGDDWMHGCYNGVEFVLCELHVFSPFKPVFNGIFVRCKINRPTSTPITTEKIAHYTSIVNFKNKYQSTIRCSEVNNNLFVAFSLKGYFFEDKNINTIAKVDKDIEMIKELVGTVKEMIDKM